MKENKKNNKMSKGEENKVFFDVLAIKDYLKILNSKKDKLKYLNELKDEYLNICYYYTDTEIQLLLLKNNLSNEYKRIRYNSWADFEHTRISRSEYETFLKHIDINLLPFVRKELRKNNVKIEGDKNRVNKNYPIYNFDSEKVLKYSNDLGDDKILYLKWILGVYFRTKIEEINRSQKPLANEGETYKELV